MHDHRLPWDIGQLRRSDLTALSAALMLCIAIPFITVPLKPKVETLLPERTVLLPPVVTIPPPKKPEPRT